MLVKMVKIQSYKLRQRISIVMLEKEAEEVAACFVNRELASGLNEKILDCEIIYFLLPYCYR